MVFSQSDTLRPIEVIGELKQFAFGSKTQIIDSVERAVFSPFLSDLLSQNTGIYLKEYGSGQLSSITLRGTGAERTAVLWNAMNINSPSLGQTDFGTVPSTLIEELGIHYGASCSKYGTNAIGGTVILNTESSFKPKTKLEYTNSIGNYGLFSSSLNALLSSKHFQSQTKIYRYDFVNDFEYEYRKETVKNENAKVHFHGLQQTFQYQNDGDRLKLSYWLHHNDRAIQPILGDVSNERLKDISSRASLQYFHDYDKSTLELSTGFIDDHQWYDGSVNAQMHIERYFAKGSWEKEMYHWLDIRIGANTNIIKAYSDNYASKTNEQRLGLYALTAFRPFRFWEINLKARKVMIEGKNTPLTPSFGSELTLINQYKHTLAFKSLIAKSYRLPTFNERYWQPGGNPAIKAEQGMHFDSGLEYKMKSKKLDFSTEVTYFDMMIDDWIIWTSTGSFWSPKNLRRVHSRGLETSTKMRYSLSSKASITLRANYTHTIATNELAIDSKDITVGNQLAYTPVQRFSTSIAGTWSRYSLILQYLYTGLRFENLDNKKEVLNFIPAYDLIHLTLGKSIMVNKHQIGLSFQIKNLLKKSYQNYLNRAMPSRTYIFSLKYHFSKNTRK